MKLFKLYNKLGEWYVIAKNPTHAEDILMDRLNRNDYGFRKDRTVYQIDIIAISKGYASEDSTLILEDHKNPIPVVEGKETVLPFTDNKTNNDKD